ncbi:UNVERIFIED_CONTAM: hypothetical protein RMT77_001226 [Armadillidium vulgare]
MYDKMSVVQQVISDARKLATRLTEHDTSMDSLLSQTQGVIKQVECMKEYCEEMNELNEAANSRPRIALIHSIQQENRHIRELQRENKELRQALEEHQNIMELIMSKYRQQIANLIAVNKTGNGQNDAEVHAKMASLVERVNEMVAVMRKATLLCEDEYGEQQRIITTLATENKGLREMLRIAVKSGSVVPPPGTSDVHTQTEDETNSLTRSPSEDLSPLDDEMDSPNRKINSNLNSFKSNS